MLQTSRSLARCRTNSSGKQKAKTLCAAEGEDPTGVTFVMDAHIREKQQAMFALHLAEKHIRLRLI